MSAEPFVVYIGLPVYMLVYRCRLSSSGERQICSKILAGCVTTAAKMYRKSGVPLYRKVSNAGRLLAIVSFIVIISSARSYVSSTADKSESEFVYPFEFTGYLRDLHSANSGLFWKHVITPTDPLGSNVGSNLRWLEDSLYE